MNEIYKFKGVSELYGLPSCVNMIDPYFKDDCFSSGIHFANPTPEEYERYQKMKEHVQTFNHEPIDFAHNSLSSEMREHARKLR